MADPQGTLVVETARGMREYALGPRTDLEATPPMLEWRTAPIAGVFFRHAPGETYELEGGAEGRVVARTLHDRGRVVAVPAVLPPAGPPRGRDPIILDPEQQRAVDLPRDVSLVLDGEAGVGKTLVALYRVAALQSRRTLVLVPTEGLRRLVRLIAERLGIRKLEIAVFDTWLLERARAAFRGLPPRISEGATAQVIHMKRHPAVRAVLRDFVGWKPPRGVDDDNISRTRKRLLHLWGDRDRMARIVAAAGGALPERAIEAVALHTRAQFERTTEQAYAHVDADRLQALDGRRLDAGTRAENASSFDIEDVPVLFELARLGAIQIADDLATYDHVVVDEAQLRAPLELAVIGGALAKGGSITLAGDHRQATDESAWFTTWAAAQAELGRTLWKEVTLAITYRSVPEIGTFARAIVEQTHASRRESAAAGRAAEERAVASPGAVASTGPLRLTQVPHALAQSALMCWQLDALVARDPWRQICVVARTPEHARRLHAELSRGLDPTLVLDGDFQFEPGIIVTTAAAVSGLEFDAVVVPDCTPSFWPATPELARSMYVAATRARDFLWLLTADAWSPLLPLGQASS